MNQEVLGMKIIRIGKTIDLGKESQDFTFGDELAYALATSMLPQLLEYKKQQKDNLVKIRNLKESIQQNVTDRESNEGELSKTQSEIKILERENSTLKNQLEEIESRPWKWFRWLYMLFMGRKWKKEREQAIEEISAVDNKIEPLINKSKTLENNILDCNKSDDQFQSELQSLEKQKTNLDVIPKIVEGIRAFDYPLIPISFNKENKGSKESSITSISFYIDPNGEPVTIELPQIQLTEKQLEHFVEELEKLVMGRVLLDAADDKERFGSWGTLYGSEKLIKSISSALKDFLEEYSPGRFEIPVIKRDSATGKFLEFVLKNHSASESVEGNILKNTEQKLQTLGQIRDQIEQMLHKNTLLDQFDLWIDDIKDGFTTPLDALEEGRHTSLGMSHQYLEQAFLNSRLTRYHFYCPKCNANKSYLRRFFNFSDEDIEELHTAKITDSLTQYQDRFFNDAQGKKFDNEDRTTIEKSWERAFLYLKELEERFYEAKSRLESGNAAKERHSMSFQQRQMHTLRGTYKSVVETLIKNPLSIWKEEKDYQEADEGKIINGKALEVLNPNTKLIYNPDPDDREPWSCPLCEVKFSNEIAFLHAVDKFRNDLVYPMLHSLWNNEAIWSKKVDLLKDVSREIRDRRVEESNALQTPINNFLSDSRQVRQSLQDSFAKGQATVRRLQQISEEFAAAGLLDQEELQRVMDSVRSSNELIDRVDERIKDIDKLERDLQRIPQDVFKDRPLPTSPEKRIIEKDAKRHLLPFLASPTNIDNDHQGDYRGTAKTVHTESGGEDIE